MLDAWESFHQSHEIRYGVNTEAATRGVLWKKGVLRISQNSQENTCVKVSFNKVAGLRPATLLKKRLAQVFFCEFSEIFKNTFFTEHLWTIASINIDLKYYKY